ncbi:MAG: DNA-directed RNA polymerase subunit beta', partial [Clostridia bacterium]|nr:DNA-directed RNA polymerase subunit beta' [Clostridia bacterium]
MFELSNFHAMRISIASPDKIREWSFGEVTKAETINYRTTKPEKDGLFCEKIFGPTKDYECSCGKYKRIRYKGIVCDKCGVEVTSSNVRRDRMGHIELAAPVSHIWFFKINPSAIGTLLEINAKELEKVLYYTEYVVIDPGTTDLEKKQIINDETYSKKIEEFGPNSFKALMGAEAIKILLSEIDLKKEIDELKQAMETAKGLRKDKITKKLEIVEAFYKSKNKPEWMILDCVPVIPPDLRPMVQLDGGRYATNDLNDLYRRVINRNNRLKKAIELGAPSVIVRNEKRMLQEAVDSLFDNGKHGKAITGGSKNRELKSIYAALKGKQGRFRQNLLGKRVDYSGRAVIVIGPELKMYQCGLPKHMALELFKPFIMKKLQDDGHAPNIRNAKRMIDREHPEAYNALDRVIKEHPVLLNRAPTLHKLSIQAFEPVLVDGNAMKLHPLVCQGFNADFDGDQMAVHVPLSLEARAEARFLMLSTNNIVKPSDGKPIVTPQQDIVLGCYYLTIENPDGKGARPLGQERAFSNENEAIVAYQMKELDLQTPIQVRKTVEFEGEKITGRVRTTVGQIIFNQVIPQDIGFVDRTKRENALCYEITGDPVGKDRLGKIVAAVYKHHGNTKTAVILDKIKELGYKYSTLSGITMNLFDMDIPKEREEIIKETQIIADQNEKMYRRGLITRENKVNRNIEIWNAATEKVSKAVRNNLKTFNPIKMIAVSKARTNPNQLNQVCDMRGIITATSAEKIDIPIKSNYRLGLSPFEYFTSARGGRKGLADTALKTADAGYLTRRLVDVAQNVVVTEDDCFANREEKILGTIVRKVEVDSTLVISLADRITGRVSVNDVVNPQTNEVIVKSNELISSDQANMIEKCGITEVAIRTILNCRAKTGCCAKCYGKDMSQERLVAIGEAVGVIAAQSVGEPGTQLTMKNFHTGGVATASDITTGLPRVEELFEARKPKGLAFISRISGTVSIEKEDKINVVTITP